MEALMTADEAQTTIRSWKPALEAHIKKMCQSYQEMDLDFVYETPVKSPEFIFKIGEFALIVGTVLDDAPDLAIPQRFKPTIVVTEVKIVKRNGFGHQQLYGARKGGDGFKLPNFSKAVAAAIKREETQEPTIIKDEKKVKKAEEVAMPALPKAMVVSGANNDGTHILHIGMVQVTRSQLCAIAAVLTNEPHRQSSSEVIEEDTVIG